jgi:hypothetical protein
MAARHRKDPRFTVAAGENFHRWIKSCKKKG